MYRYAFFSIQPLYSVDYNQTTWFLPWVIETPSITVGEAVVEASSASSSEQLYGYIMAAIIVALAILLFRRLTMLSTAAWAAPAERRHRGTAALNVNAGELLGKGTSSRSVPPCVSECV